MEKLEHMKERVCERLEFAIEERGPQRMDVNEVGKLADIVKDLAQAMESCAEAAYYGSISEAMSGNLGYSQGGGTSSSAPVQHGGMSGYSAPYGYMGYHDSIEKLKSAPPEERERAIMELQRMGR